MKTFTYKAFDKSGAKIEGEIDAQDEHAVLAELSRENLIPYEVSAYRESTFSSFQSQKVSLADIEFFTSELSLLLKTGVRVDKGLEIISKTKAKPSLANILKTISKDIKEGQNLSGALRAHPKVFDDLYCNLVELGESSGDLATVFSGLAQDLKFRRELRGKVISALTYPSVIFFVCLMSIVFIFNVIIPKMADMFSQAKELPWYTSAMLDMSSFMQSYQLFVFGAFIVIPLATVSTFKSPSAKKYRDKLLLRLPLVKNAVVTLERIRFNSGLALMIKSGLAIDRALELANGNIKNSLILPEMQVARKKVYEGEKLSTTLSQTQLYPPFFVSLLEVGEESGELAIVFDEISQRSRADFESWAEKLTTLLEPLMILFMGGVVGGVVVTMLMSMVSLNDVAF